jgi:hypothetical protein
LSCKSEREQDKYEKRKKEELGKKAPWSLDDEGEGSGKEGDLALLGHEAEELLDDGSELGREKLVRLVHHEHRALAQVGDTLTSKVKDTTGSTDEDVNGLAETEDVVAKGGSSGSDHDLNASVLAERLANLRCLKGELTGGDEEEGLDLLDFGVDTLEGRDDEGGGLSRSVLGTSEDVATGEGDGDGFFLNGRGTLELRTQVMSGIRRRKRREEGTHTGLKDTHQQLALEEVVLELVTLGVGDILQGGKRKEKGGSVRRFVATPLSFFRLRVQREKGGESVDGPQSGVGCPWWGG